MMFQAVGEILSAHAVDLNHPIIEVFGSFLCPSVVCPVRLLIGSIILFCFVFFFFFGPLLCQTCVVFDD
jgi:hypothetical protein